MSSRADPTSSQRSVEVRRLLQYFQSSPFEYLALEHAGRSVCLRRAPTTAAAAVLAPSVGVVALAPGQERLPAPGTPVRFGEILFAIRRFRSSVEVAAPAEGSLAALTIEPGMFVEFGQRLATIEPAIAHADAERTEARGDT